MISRHSLYGQIKTYEQKYKWVNLLLCSRYACLHNRSWMLCPMSFGTLGSIFYFPGEADVTTFGDHTELLTPPCWLFWKMCSELRRQILNFCQNIYAKSIFVLIWMIYAIQKRKGTSSGDRTPPPIESSTGVEVSMSCEYSFDDNTIIFIIFLFACFCHTSVRTHESSC